MINIFGVIGVDALAADIVPQIQAVKGDVIDITIMSPGGSVVEGMAIFDELELQKKAGKTVNITTIGQAASIAAFISLVGNVRNIGDNAEFMVHNSMTGQGGNRHELADDIQRLDEIDSKMISAIMGVTSLTEEEAAALLKEERFMTADEAVEIGFATNKTSALDLAAIYNKKQEPIMASIKKEIKVKVKLDLAEVDEVKQAVGLLAHIKSFFTAEVKAEEHEEEEDEEAKAKAKAEEEAKAAEKLKAAEHEEEEEEEEEEEDENKALKAKIEALETELTAKHNADFIAKKDKVFEAIADNKLTLAEGKNLMAESQDDVDKKLEGLQANATGYGNTGRELSNKTQASKAGVYEALTGFDKTAYFNENKQDILNELKGK